MFSQNLGAEESVRVPPIVACVPRPSPSPLRIDLISYHPDFRDLTAVFFCEHHSTYIISYHTPAQASGYPTRVHKLAVLQTEKVAGFVERLYASRIHDLESLRRVAVECGAGHVPHRPTPRSMLHCDTANQPDVRCATGGQVRHRQKELLGNRQLQISRPRVAGVHVGELSARRDRRDVERRSSIGP